MELDRDFATDVSLAWHRKMEFVELINRAAQLEAQQARHLAAVLYQTWLSRNTSPYAQMAYFNLGVTLTNLEDFSAAETAYRKAIELQSSFVQPHLNLGTVLERQGRIAEALDEWRWVEKNIAVTDDSTQAMVLMALNQLGRVLELQKQYQEALAMLTRSLSIKPDQPDTLHHWIFLRQRQCLWPVYTPLPGISHETMVEATSALAMLSISDDPAQQLRAAHHFVKKKVKSDVPALAQPQGYGHRKLRIGYASSDFSLHPVSMLTAELFELHNREQFEVYGYCWSPEDGSDLRKRVIGAMDHFHRINTLSDEAAAQLIRSHEIDILVDLQGQTAGARPNMLAYRPAPLQITYLGLPATTGLPSIDYVIADRFLIPEASLPYYSEKPLYMPDIYQCSDRKRTVGPLPTRADFGLPDKAFVFCSLNNNYKYTVEVFDAWMRILQRTPGSVLWLLTDNPWAQDNLQREAQQRGIDPGRLFFAPRVAPADYLARYTVADLFLDTFPFNAGTTANDALWMGLPVLTLTGRAFPARMAGALLTAAGLPELITYTLADYEEKAVALAHERPRLQQLHDHLVQTRSTGVLFDTPRFVRHLEERLLTLTKALPHKPAMLG